jgi:hypothetical protein
MILLWGNGLIIIQYSKNTLDINLKGEKYSEILNKHLVICKVYRSLFTSGHIQNTISDILIGYVSCTEHEIQ